MTCRMVGCTRSAVTIVNVSGVGERALCRQHIEWMTAQGMALGARPARQPRPETPGFGPAWLRRLVGGAA